MSPLAYSHKPLPPINGQPPHTGVKSNISRRFDRIRGKSLQLGTDSEASDAPMHSWHPMLGLANGGGNTSGAYSDLSDAELRSDRASLHHRSPGPRRQPLLHHASDYGSSPPSPVKRPLIYRSPTSVELHKRENTMDLEGYRSSGAEDGGSFAGGAGHQHVVGRRRPGRRLLAAAWQGFKGTLDSYPPFDHTGALAAGLGGHNTHSSGSYSPLIRASSAAARRRRTVMYVEESDDDDEVVPREILDIGDDEHAALNGQVVRLGLVGRQADLFVPRSQHPSRSASRAGQSRVIHSSSAERDRRFLGPTRAQRA